MDGQLLEQIQKIVEGEDQITNKAALRLILTSVVQLTNRVDEIDGKIDHLSASQDNDDLENRQLAKIFTEKIQKLQDDLDSNYAKKSDIQAIQNNLALRVGDLIAKHPKQSAVIFVIAVLIASAVSQSNPIFWIFHLFGVPITLIQP